jgi:hypothetical protein
MAAIHVGMIALLSLSDFFPTATEGQGRRERKSLALNKRTLPLAAASPPDQEPTKRARSICSIAER